MIDEKAHAIIKNILEKGDRVELIPGPQRSVKIVHIKRKIVKTGQEKDCSKC